MAAPRPDVKYHLDAPDKAALDVFAEHEGLTRGELTEKIVKEWLCKRLHDATVLTNKLQRAGIVRNEAGEAGAGRK